jgi:hypothetical protein
MTNCRTCQEEIVFSDENMTPGGKYIPLNPETFERHDCPDFVKKQNPLSQYRPCRTCGKDVYFEEQSRSEKTGKLIPQSRYTNRRHQCIAVPPNKYNEDEWQKEREAEKRYLG